MKNKIKRWSVLILSILITLASSILVYGEAQDSTPSPSAPPGPPPAPPGPPPAPEDEEDEEDENEDGDEGSGTDTTPPTPEDPKKPGGTTPEDPTTPGGPNPENPKKPGGTTPEGPKKPGGTTPEDPNTGGTTPEDPKKPGGTTPEDPNTGGSTPEDPKKPGGTTPEDPNTGGTTPEDPTTPVTASILTGTDLPEGKVMLKHLAKEVKDRIEKSEKNSGGITSSIAVANIPQVSMDRRFSVGAGVSYYDRNGAIAVGISGQDKDHIVIYKAAVGTSFKGDFNVGAGLNVNFGKIGNKKDDLKALYAKINSVGDKINNLKIKNRELKLRLSKKAIKYIISNFDLDHSELKGLVELINTNYANGTVEITGFTDRAYTEEYNLDLGLKRAKTVKEMLMNLGLSKDIKILIRSDAFNEITDGNASDLRRVEIKISDTVIY
ncbi:OmpA family protein [Oceanivirga miroungae]|uniref:OmpA/MotB domain-containing protein n=1 Tax=Oceanivirga miroungae TaxID=1130046 RepID=A0A6I8M9E1_9FUSO|nr:OmpA family protein [Oceanivirga miroungae]VWL84888.1 OmpA/MotB domain-containing protein [Oceanivirga miroungae]